MRKLLVYFFAFLVGLLSSVSMLIEIGLLRLSLCDIVENYNSVQSIEKEIEEKKGIFSIDV